MFDKIFNILRKWAASADRDRIDQKFEKVDEKFDHFDDRLDDLEKSQAQQNEKLSAIHQISLANNEAIEQKVNRSTVTAQSVREIVDVRLEGFQEGLKRLESLISQVLRRDCTPP